MTRVAAIGCGTNSIRLFVVDAERKEDGSISLRDLTRQMRIVRLGQGIDKTGRLDPAATDRTIDAIIEYERMISGLGATAARFVTISASRDAENRDNFVAAVREVLNIEPKVVEGAEEASLSFTDTVSGFGADTTAPMLVVDIGGGPTELVLGDSKVRQAISIDMDAVRMTEKFLAHCSPEAGVPLEDQERTIARIDEQLDTTEKVVDIDRVHTLIGVASTITTLTAQGLGLVAYQPEPIHGARLSLEETEATIRPMVDQPIAVKTVLGFMPKGRQDVIAGGALIRSRVVAQVLEKAATRGTVISTIITPEHGILGGIAMSLAWQCLFTTPSLPPSSIDEDGVLIRVEEKKKNSCPREWKLKRQDGRRAARWLVEKRGSSWG